MFEKLINFFKNVKKDDQEKKVKSKDAAKERLHLVLMQDRANVSADFLELMKQEIIDVIKKYVDVDENAIDVRLTNKTNDDGTNGAPALYANIPIAGVKYADTNSTTSNEPKVETTVQDNVDQIENTEEVSTNIDNSKEESKEILNINEEEVQEEIKEAEEIKEKVESETTAESNN